MPLESATYLDDLDPANPAATDLIAQGDDHIRLIKTVLQATFPNITGPVTLTQTEINDLPDTVGAIPFGLITMWYGSAASCPVGWAICNGTTVPKSDLSGNVTPPDLRDKVVIGTGSLQSTVGGSYGAGASPSATSSASGSHTHAVSGGAHTHTGTCDGHALTIAELPAHSHTLGQGGSGSTNGAGGTGGTDTTFTTSSVGSGSAHTHPITLASGGTHSHTVDTVAAHTHTVSVATYQPSLSLHYIMKI